VALVVVVLVLAAVVGVAAGGRPTALSRVPLAGWRLLLGAAASQLAGTLVSRGSGTEFPYEIGSLAAVALLIGFLLSNSRLPGVPLVALGLLLNTAVVLANGAMPVSRWAAARAGVDLTEIATGLDARHALAAAGTSLRRLSDVVPVPIPGFPEVVSAGDVLVAAGLALLLWTGLLWPQTGPDRHDTPESPVSAGSAAPGTPGDPVRDTTRASASTTRGSYS
jgi:Family of unknown function (DUF5317)